MIQKFYRVNLKTSFSYFIKNKCLIIASLLVIIAWKTTATAQNINRKIDKSEPNSTQAPADVFDSDDDLHRGTGLSAVFGLDIGMLQSLSKNREIESNKSGYSIAGKALLSLYVDKMILEAGPGWLYSSLSGNKVPRKVGDTDSDASDILTSLGFVEFNAKYRATERVQFGPVAQVLFGADSTFSPFEARQSRPHIFAGFAFASGDPSKAMDFRWGAQVTTDVNISERQVFSANLSLQFGVPIIKSDIQIREKQVIKIQEKQVDRIVNRFLYILDTEVVNFETGKAQLLPESRLFLFEFGKFLAAHPEIWDGLDIAGHTDNRGSVESNKKLSRDRADEVKAVLLTGGNKAERIRTYGFGSERPINTGTDDVSLAQNRRVELSFEGIKNVQLMRNEVDRIRKTLSKPKTCSQGHCK